LANHHQTIVTEQELSMLATRPTGLGPAQPEAQRPLQKLDRTVDVLASAA